MIEQSPESTSADSSVGRAEDCRKADILRSLVRVRVGGWHEKVFFETKFSEHFRRLFFEDPEQFSLNKWSKRAKKKFFKFKIMKNPYQNFCLFFFHLVNKVFRWKKIKQSPENKSKRLTNRQPPIAQLVERRTVEKMISFGPWFESGSADGIISLKKSIRYPFAPVDDKGHKNRQNQSNGNYWQTIVDIYLFQKNRGPQLLLLPENWGLGKDSIENCCSLSRKF